MGTSSNPVASLTMAIRLCLAGDQVCSRPASHNMPNVFEVADRIPIARLGGSAGIITPQSHTPTEPVAIMTGATTLQKR